MKTATWTSAFFTRPPLHAVVAGALLLSSQPLTVQAQASDVQRVCSGDLMIFSEPSFEIFDKDKDEGLDDTETADCEALRTIFAELDLDADDRLSRQEYMAFPTIWKQRVLAFGEPK